jgi:hypothetical protein
LSLSLFLSPLRPLFLHRFIKLLFFLPFFPPCLLQLVGVGVCSRFEFCICLAGCAGFESSATFDVGYGKCPSYAKSSCDCNFVHCKEDEAVLACPVACQACNSSASN